MAILTGLFRITRQPELRYVPSGEAVCNLALAYNYGTKKNEKGFLPSMFVEAGLWGKRAESLQPHLEKGKQISAVLEDVHIEHFDKSDGTQGVKLAARVASIEFVSIPREGGQQQDPPTQQQPAPAARQATRQAPKAAPGGSGFDDMDDIPFITLSMHYDMTTSKDRKMAQYDY